jgi:hypothetical protein
MRLTCQKLAAICTMGITLNVSLATQPALASTLFWDLNFFNDNGVEVGTGEFTSEPDKTALASTFAPYLQPNFVERSFEVENYLTSFSVKILRNERKIETFSDKTRTWIDPSIGTRQIVSAPFNSLPRIIKDDWRFGERGLISTYGPYTEGLFMEGKQQNSNNILAGSWLELRYLPFSRKFGFPPIKNTGSWRATVRNPQTVPESSTVLGLATFGLGCLLLLKRTTCKKA